MSKILVGVIVGGLLMFAYQRSQRSAAEEQVAYETQAYETQTAGERDARETASLEVESNTRVERDTTRFRCDGRTRCPQMTSCAEAKFFLENCPGVKMDGEGDGVPCEGQWCGRQ
jgi:hypothetical protein